MEICAFLDVRLFSIPHVTVHQVKTNMKVYNSGSFYVAGRTRSLSELLEQQWVRWRPIHKRAEEEAQSLINSYYYYYTYSVVWQ